MDWSTFDSQVLAAIIGAGLVLVVQGVIRWWTRPILTADFKNSDNAYFTATTEGPPGSIAATNVARYLRVRVANRGYGVAKACRAYLVNVEKLDDTQLWRPTVYCDSLRLNWSAQPDNEALLALDLPNGVNQFVDVLSVRPDHIFYRMELGVHLRRYLELFDERGTLRFTVLVAADGVAPAKVRVAFRWSGEFTTCEAWRA